MPSANTNRASVVSLALRDRRDDVAGGLFRHPRQRGQLLHRQPVDVGRRAHDPGVDQRVDELVAQALDVHRPPAREVQQRLLALRRADEPAGAARDRLVGQAHDRRPALGACASASRRRARPAAACPARRARPRESRRRRGARSRVSPTWTSLRRTSSSLCSVALVTVTPPTNTGASRATGVSAPVRPTCTSMPSTSVAISSAGNLCASANRGARDTKPSASCRARSLTL